ncbi:AlbA family DNA-binding domain-containing protein [Streptomyces tibetensis]|uniref:AlbA family DNA-binding domain-containing protein n=1 Tax=Streptomyces tibetensis TaxID=2382123 RepID=UPI0033C71DA6
MAYVERIEVDPCSQSRDQGTVILTSGEFLTFDTFGLAELFVSWTPESGRTVPSIELAEELAALAGKDANIHYWGRRGARHAEVHVYSSPSRESSLSLIVRLHEAVPNGEVEPYVSQFLKRYAIAVASCRRNSDDDGSYWELSCHFVEGTSKTMGELYDIATELQASTVKPLEIELKDAKAAAAALADGEIWRFMGMAENEWLEVKSQLPDLSKAAGKFTLCKDVAQFANSRLGGLLIYGLFTKNSGDGDRIRKIAPISPDSRLKNSLDATLRGQIYPAMANLRIEAVSMDGGWLLYIYVPPQADSAKPFIVEGSGISELGKGNVFAVPVRNGDRIVPVTGKTLHSLLAGRVTLSG